MIDFNNFPQNFDFTHKVVYAGYSLIQINNSFTKIA